MFNFFELSLLTVLKTLKYYVFPNNYPNPILLTLLGVRWRCFKCGTINHSSGADRRPVGYDGDERGGSDDRSLEEYAQTTPQEQNVASVTCAQSMPVVTCMETILESEDKKPATHNGQHLSMLHILPVTECDSQSGVLVTRL